MNKDKELREILGECGLDAPDEDEIQKAMGLIEALYKPLDKDELEKIIDDWVKKYSDPFEEILYKGQREGIVDAIINAREER